MSDLLKPCIEAGCGELSDGPRCMDHRKPELPKGSSTQRGYDYTWRKLSEKARRLQPFCLDCGATDDLTTDHSPEAWARKAKGLPIRLRDVSVLCRPCNSARGAARDREGATV